jgi:hypothetical protein
MRTASSGKTAVFVEAALLIIISVIAMTEGIHLVVRKEPNTLYDPLGPGYYALAVSICLLAVGVAYLVCGIKTPPEEEVVSVDRKMKVRLTGMVAACAVYIILISIIGYLVATIVFFLVEFKIEGIGSWLRVAILSLVASCLYYLIFVQICSMIFPAGLIF